MMVTARQATPGTRIIVKHGSGAGNPLGGFLTATVVRWERSEHAGYAHLWAQCDGWSAGTAQQMGQYTAEEEFKLAP